MRLNRHMHLSRPVHGTVRASFCAVGRRRYVHSKRGGAVKNLMQIASLVLLLSLAVMAGATDDVDVDPHELIGVWKVCYEPGLDGVSEIDAGYLIFMPDGKYFQLSEGCCRETDQPPPEPRMGRYSTVGNTVTLVREGEGPGQQNTELIFTRDRNVVFFDNLRGSPLNTFVLHGRGGINYGFGKAYWRSSW